MPLPPASQLYPYASVSSSAEAEFQKASLAAQQKAGHITLYSPKYYAACTLGGLFACGLTHTALTPLDLIKCQRQVSPTRYPSNAAALRTLLRAGGLRSIFTGWSPTLVGYSAQGALKYGGYEFFKKTYGDAAGDANAKRYRTAVYLAASASAEFIADIALCPLEAVKVRMQTAVPAPPFAGVVGGVRAVVAQEGVAGLYKGLYPLWGRQIPYTMMKFASFETVVEAMYARLPGRKEDYNKGAQAGVAFAAGYVAGILCAVVSHPADVMVSKLNADRKAGEAFGAAIGRLYGQIGFGGLWNGLPVRIVMIGTLTGLQWLLYDGFKIFFGLPTTGGGGGRGGVGGNDWLDG